MLLIISSKKNNMPFDGENCRCGESRSSGVCETPHSW